MTDTEDTVMKRVKKGDDPQAYSKDMARKIIRLWMEGPGVESEELRNRFFAWLTDDHNREIKDEVMMEYFDKELSRMPAPNEDTLEQMKMLFGKLGIDRNEMSILPSQDSGIS